jgi:hypothetical protein
MAYTPSNYSHAFTPARNRYFNSSTNLQKMDSESNRLWRFHKPEWLNNSTVRNAGVYTSGALVKQTYHARRSEVIKY